MILENHNCQHRSKQLSSSVVLNLFQLEESYFTRKHCWTISLIVLFEKHTMAKIRNTVANIFWDALHCLNQPLVSENCSPHLYKWPIMLYLRSEIFINEILFYYHNTFKEISEKHAIYPFNRYCLFCFKHNENHWSRKYTLFFYFSSFIYFFLFFFNWGNIG